MDSAREYLMVRQERGKAGRPLPAARSSYITPEGAARLRAELDELWRRKRPQVTRAVAEAAAQGDRSENAEYIYGKKQLREIDRRVRYLRKRLDALRVVEEPPTDATRVYFGAWVGLVDEQGQHNRYRLVGPDEHDLHADYISLEAPLGRGLLGKSLGDEILVTVPGGQRRLRICRIAYGLAPPADGD
jgi:transcription elongation factor GreB